MRVDGKEISNRNRKGELVFMAEFRDASKKPYRSTMKVNLEEYSKANSHHELECVLHAFVLPGEYDLSLGVFEPATEKRSVTHRVLHVPAPANDPLPELWAKLPPVQFVDLPEPPDRWFLPDDRERFAFPIKPRRAVRLQVLANVSPSETSRRQRRSFDRNMEAIIPALKILSQIDVPRDFAVVDVARRRVEFEQHDRGPLDWAALRQKLQEDSPNKIDAGSLRDRDQEAQFFSDQAARLASGPPDERRVVVVLSAPLTFQTHQDVQALERSGDARVYFLRFQTLRIFTAPQGQLPAMPADDLSRVLKPMQPKVMNLYSAMDFRKALAAILKEIEQ